MLVLISSAWGCSKGCSIHPSPVLANYKAVVMVRPSKNTQWSGRGSLEGLATPTRLLRIGVAELESATNELIGVVQ